MEFQKATAEFVDVIEGAGALGMTGELGPLPGGQGAVELMLDLGEFLRNLRISSCVEALPELAAASFSIFSSISRIGFSNSR